MFSKRLKLLRIEKSLTQKELAEKLNIKNTTISKYELGEREPDIETLTFLSDFFNVSLDYLLGKSNERNSKEEDLGIVTKAFHLAEDVDELPKEALDQIDEYIRLMKLKYKDKK